MSNPKDYDRKYTNEETERWNRDPFDDGVWGETHKTRGDGSKHHTLWKGDSRLSWDTDKNGDLIDGTDHFNNQ